MMNTPPANKLQEIALQNTLEGILVTDDACHILFVNQAFSHITGYQPEEVIGKNPSLLKSGRHGQMFFSDMWSTIAKEGRWQGEIWNRRKNGDFFPAILTIVAVYDHFGTLTHYTGSMIDIKSQKVREVAQRKRITEDAVTGLLNKRAFRDRMLLSLRRTERSNNILVILFIRFPYMTEIKNSLGDAIVDKILLAIAQQLLHLLRAGEDVARVGDRQFALCLADLNSIEHAARVAQRIIQSFEKPLTIDDRHFFLPPKIGVSLYPSDGRDPEELLTKAETAARLAFEEGGESFRFFIPDMHDRAIARFKLEGDLRKAIENNEFVIYYQPKVCLKTGAVTGAEALLRWSPQGGEMISPKTFIPVAEETELILPLGEWVLTKACQDALLWKNDRLVVSVNLSALQLRDSSRLPELTEKTLRETGLSPARLKLELTESKQMDYEEVYRILNKLNALGISLSIDDFGTGYSNFSYLSTFPLRELKLDQSYIQKIGQPREFKMIGSILTMAKGFGFTVVAEGVEDRREVSCLAAFGCAEIQGYCVSRPLPMDDFIEFLQHHKPSEWQYL